MRIPNLDYVNFTNVLKTHLHKIYHRIASLATFIDLNPIAMKEAVFLTKIFYATIYMQNTLLDHHITWPTDASCSTLVIHMHMKIGMK